MEALLGLFLGAIITYWVLKYIKIQKMKDRTNSQSVIIMERIRKVWKLITVEGEFAEIYHYENTKERFMSMVSSKKKAILLINAKAYVGYDLSKIKMEAVNEHGGKVGKKQNKSLESQFVFTENNQDTAGC